MANTKHIDDLVISHETREAELREIGTQIRQSGRTVAVAFIDLSDSTKLKEVTKPEAWLGYVYRFIRTMEQVVGEFNGTVVKRIGDEVLVTFYTVPECEEFLTALESNQALADYEFRTAVDFGEVFFFKFREHLEDDPYGPPVDRCSRISKLAHASTVLCSTPYYEQLGSLKHSYVRIGPFKLAGIAQPQDLYLRRHHDAKDIDKYLSPLLNSLNDRAMNRPRYHSVARIFSREYFEVRPADRGYPFLLRELINVPKLPLSLPNFLEKMSNLEYEDESLNYVGYLVEWEGQYSSADANMLGDCLTVFVESDGKLYRNTVVLRMPLVMTDIMRGIPKGTLIRFRGIIVGIDLKVPILDYVDIEIPAQSSP